MINQITWSAFQALVKAGADFQLIDVREESEHEYYNIGGDLMPLSELMRHSPNIAKDKQVIFYCKRGIRSQLAIQQLTVRFGVNTNFYNLEGGIIHQLPKFQLPEVTETRTV